MMKYQPINCNYYDVLEGYATLRQKVNIEYLDEQNKLVTAETLFKDFQTNDKEEFAILANGTKIRLDQIKKVTPLRE